MQTDTATITELFGSPIYTYTRAEAIADGIQTELPRQLAREAGIKFPVFVTSEVWDACCAVPEGCAGWQDETGRIWDVLNMLRFAISRSKGGDTIRVCVHVIQNSRQLRPRPVFLKACCGPVDHDNPEPAITIMMPDQD